MAKNFVIIDNPLVSDNSRVIRGPIRGPSLYHAKHVQESEDVKTRLIASLHD